MRRAAPWVLVVGALMALAGPAQAQESTIAVDRDTAQGQDIRFKDDPMTALAGNPVGAQLTGFHPPHRFSLLAPRKTWVPELLKSVESL